MLQTLVVSNMALIGKAEVEFGPGLNILSGETGAGKSILLGAVQTALGGRVPKDIVGSRGDSAYTELVFSTDGEMAARLSEEFGTDREETLTVSRRIGAGRSVCRVNGEMRTVQETARLGAFLLDIYGQREHQVLLKRQSHLEILDAFCQDESAAPRQEVAALVRKLRETEAELASMSTDEASRRREISYLTFALGEIEEAHLVPGEDAELAARFKKLANEQLLEEGAAKLHSLISSDEDGSAGDRIGEALHVLSRIESCDEEGLASIRSQLYDLESLLTDLAGAVADYRDDLTSDGESMAEVEERLDLIHGLKSKYGDSIPDILAYAEEQQKKLDELTGYDERKARLGAERERLLKTLDVRCRALTELRKRAAVRLEREITQALTELNFAQVKFEAAFEETEDFTVLGRDRVEFMISVNPGEPVRPLVQVASGGELSRIMLAVKTVLADTDRIPTLIFDEIDAGISGRTAQLVAEKLAAISRTHQVICISHLPQITAMADRHYLIEKTSDAVSTDTHIREITGEERVDELSRIIGGAAITEATRAQAREILGQARGRKEQIRKERAERS